MNSEELQVVISANIDKLIAAVESATKSLEGVKKTTKKVSDEMDSFTSSVNKQAKDLQDLKRKYVDIVATQGDESDAAKEVAREIERLSGELKDNRKKLIDAANAADKFDQNLQDVGDGADDAGDSIDDTGDKSKELGEKGKGGFGKFAGAAGAAVGVVVAACAAMVAAVVGIGKVFYDLAEDTREYRLEMARLAENSKNANAEFDVIKRKMQEVGAITGEVDSAFEGMNMLLATGLDTSQIELAADALAGAASKFDGLKFEGIAEGLQETLATGVAVGPFAELVERTGTNLEEFNKGLAACTTEAERNAYAIKFLTESGLIEANNAFKETNKDLFDANMATQQWNDALAELGAVAEPIISFIKTGLAGAIKEIVPLFQEVSDAIMDVINGVEGGEERLTAAVGNLVNGLVQKLNELLPAIITVAFQIVEALITGLATAIPEAINVISAMLPSLINALLAAIPLLVSGIVGAVPALLDAVFLVASEILIQLPIIAQDIILAVVGIIPQLAQSIASGVPMIISAAFQLLTGIINALPIIIPEIVAALPSLIYAIVGVLVGSIDAIVEGAIVLLNAIIDAIPYVIPVIVGAIPGIIVAITGALLNSIPQIMTSAKELFMGIVLSIPRIIPALINALGMLVSTIITNLVDRCKEIMEFDWTLPKLKLPHVSIKGSFSLDPPSIPTFSIDWYARGGVFDKPVLFNSAFGLGGLGEAGAEAVVPLENNLGWLDKLANMLDERMSGRTAPVIMQVDGRTFGEVCESSLNQLTRQRGKCGLNMI